MFTEQLPPELFATQREFIKKMDGNRDFVWWAEALVTEETKELKEAYEAEEQDIEAIFKELADLVYVVAGFYNTMPNYPRDILNDDLTKKVMGIIDDAALITSQVCNEMKIPINLVYESFLIVHGSNMSKINPKTGKPDRREDGKILKGPNYVAPDLSGVIRKWTEFRKTYQNPNKEEVDASPTQH